MDMIDILMAKSAAVNAAKDYTDQKTQSLMGGVIYKGEVDYYNDLPAAADVEEGWSYTVKYAGTSGTVADGTEYVWGKTSPNSELGWISFSKDCYSKAELEAPLSQIETNKNNISSLEGDIFNSLKITDMTFVSNGYVKADGTIDTQSPSNAVFSMYLHGIKQIAIAPSQALSAGLAYGKITSANGTLKQVFVGNNRTGRRIYNINDAADDDILYISWYGYKSNPSSYYDEIEVSKCVKNINPYSHCVDKTIIYSGKKLQFFGDSITYGYLAGGAQSQYNYPSVFAAKVGASSYINNGVSGSTLSIVSGYVSIYQTIQSNLDTTADVVFVSGGVNDWGLGVDEFSVRTAISNICTYLKNHFTGKVIFITPINEAGRTPNVNPTTSLNAIRRAITEIALSNEYNVVQGNLFPFPTKYDETAYISTMFQDKIHPTDIGYKMYAQALIDALL